MFRALVVLASLIGAAAFAPAARMARSSALKMSYEGEAGVTAPAGFFDPLGLSKDIDAETFAKYRSSEIKHGRVCQLAVLGYIVPEVFRFPGEIAPGVSFASIPNGIAAIEAVPALGWFQMFFLIGAVDYALETTGASPLAPAGTKQFDSAEEELEKTNKELNNGRLAMLATLELLRHDSQQLIGGMYKDDATMAPLITGLPFLYGN
jgi:Chlorophyll A-B binding protein